MNYTKAEAEMKKSADDESHPETLDELDTNPSTTLNRNNSSASALQSSNFDEDDFYDAQQEDLRRSSTGTSYQCDDPGLTIHRQHSFRKDFQSFFRFSSTRRRTKKKDNDRAQVDHASGRRPRDLFDDPRVSFHQLLIGEDSKHSSAVWILAFNPTGLYLASAGQSKNIRCWKASASTNDFESSHPYRVFHTSHAADIIDLSWSARDYLLSASFDSTIRCWHPDQDQCLQVFQHSASVTCVMFHPTMTDFFLTGSGDKKLRMWSQTSGRVQRWAQLSERITALCMSGDNGALVAVGLINGQISIFHCIVPEQHQKDTAPELRYYTDVQAKNRYGKYKIGTKVTALQFSRSFDSQQPQWLVVTTNDSRIRVFSTTSFTLLWKCKGHVNQSSFLRATMSPDERMIVCGSENEDMLHTWSLQAKASSSRASYVRQYHLSRKVKQPHHHRLQSIPTTCIAAAGALHHKKNKTTKHNRRPECGITATAFSPSSTPTCQVLVRGTLGGQVSVFHIKMKTTVF